MSTARRFIISSGDISDVDGLYALAKYAATGADVMFVMNYPAYLGVSDGSDELLSPGKGYKYGTQLFLDAFSGSYSESDREGATYLNYKKLIDDDYAYISDISLRIKQIITDLAFFMVSKIWNDVNLPSKGTLYFCVGGVNSFNPFSKNALKNEIYVYYDFILKGGGMQKLSSCLEGDLFDGGGDTCSTTISDLLAGSRDVHVDFNGSMAFFNTYWVQILNRHKDLIKGVFVMGGVFSYEPPGTMSSVPNILNRFSCATMNQLYFPRRTASFFDTVRELCIPVYVVANNSVRDLVTFTPPTETGAPPPKKTDTGWISFFDLNFATGFFSSSLTGGDSILKSLASVYYNSRYSPPRKAFDYYTAIALVSRMSVIDIGSDALFYYDTEYGLSLISHETSWDKVTAEFFSFAKTQQANFVDERNVVTAALCKPPMFIKNIEFNDDIGSFLKVRPPAQSFHQYVDYKLNISTDVTDIRCNGPFDCSNAVRNLEKYYMPDTGWVGSCTWQDVRLSGNKLLGAHVVFVKAVVFETPVTWVNKEYSTRHVVKCVIKCQLAGTATDRFNFREFEDLFQVRKWDAADGLMIAFYESDNLKFTYK